MTAPTVRYLGHGHYVRDVHGELTSAGYPLVIHLAGRDDTTPAHLTYPAGYSSRCGWCYLGANHSDAAHDAELDCHPPLVQQDREAPGSSRPAAVLGTGSLGSTPGASPFPDETTA